MENLSPKAGDLEPIETASRDEIAALQLDRMKWSVRHAYDHVAHYRAAFDEAGVARAAFAALSPLAAQSKAPDLQRLAATLEPPPFADGRFADAPVAATPPPPSTVSTPTRMARSAATNSARRMSSASSAASSARMARPHRAPRRQRRACRIMACACTAWAGR